jgi:cell division protein FtsB
MRVFPARRRYRCTVCHGTMLLKLDRRVSARQWLTLLAGTLLLLVTAWFGPDLYQAMEDRQARRALEAYE